MGATAVGSLSRPGGISPYSGAAASGITDELGVQSVLIQLTELINQAALPPSSKVTISDAAKGMLGDSQSANASMGELSQALIVALMLQLLDV